jgi:hypothetical protein
LNNHILSVPAKGDKKVEINLIQDSGTASGEGLRFPRGVMAERDAAVPVLCLRLI